MLAEIYYICDGKACKNCKSLCKYTHDQKHAVYAPKKIVNNEKEWKEYINNIRFELDTIMYTKENGKVEYILQLFEKDKVS